MVTGGHKPAVFFVLHVSYRLRWDDVTSDDAQASLLAKAQRQEIEKLKEEVEYWKSKYEYILRLYINFTSQPQTVQDLHLDRKQFMPGNVQHCRNEIAARTPEQATNPRHEPEVHLANYSYVVYGEDSQFAQDLQASYNAARKAWAT